MENKRDINLKDRLEKTEEGKKIRKVTWRERLDYYDREHPCCTFIAIVVIVLTTALGGYYMYSKYVSPYTDPFSPDTGNIIGFSTEAVITDKYKQGLNKIFEVDVNGVTQKVIVKKEDNFSKKIGEKVNILSLRMYKPNDKKLIFARKKYNNVLKSEVKRGVDYIYYKDTNITTNLYGDILD